ARLITNPASVGGQVGIGPAGNQATLTKLMERTGTPLSRPVTQKLLASLENGSPSDKVRVVETLSKFAVILGADGTNDAARQMSGQIAEAVRRMTADPDPAVRSWAAYVFCINTQDKTALDGLLHDSSWIARAWAGVPSDTRV